MTDTKSNITETRECYEFFPKETYETIYYKIFREDMIHNDHEYKIGLNILNWWLESGLEIKCTLEKILIYRNMEQFKPVFDWLTRAKILNS